MVIIPLNHYVVRGERGVRKPERTEEVIWLQPSRGRSSRKRLTQYELTIRATKKYGYAQVSLYLGAALRRALGLEPGQRVHLGIRNIQYDENGHVNAFELLIKPAPDGPFVLRSPRKGERTGLRIDGLASALKGVLGAEAVDYIVSKINGRRRVPITKENDVIVAFIRI